jgi:hypothetical protein
MKRSIDYYDIEIFGKTEIKEDPINAGYNLGDLLNMPFLYGVWEQNPHGGKERLDRMNIIGKAYPGSILSNYISDRPEDEPIPNMERRTKQRKGSYLVFHCIISDWRNLVFLGDKSDLIVIVIPD